VHTTYKIQSRSWAIIFIKAIQHFYFLCTKVDLPLNCLYYSDIEIRLRHKVCAGHKFVLACRGGVWNSDCLQSTDSLDLQVLDSEVTDISFFYF